MWRGSTRTATYTSNGGGAVPATMVRPAAARGALPARRDRRGLAERRYEISPTGSRRLEDLVFVPDDFYGGSRRRACPTASTRSAGRLIRLRGRAGRRDGAHRGARAAVRDRAGRASRSRWRAPLAGMKRAYESLIEPRGGGPACATDLTWNGEIGATGSAWAVGAPAARLRRAVLRQPADAFYGNFLSWSRPCRRQSPAPRGIYVEDADHRRGACLRRGDGGPGPGSAFLTMMSTCAPARAPPTYLSRDRVRVFCDAWARNVGFLVEQLLKFLVSAAQGLTESARHNDASMRRSRGGASLRRLSRRAVRRPSSPQTDAPA